MEPGQTDHGSSQTDEALDQHGRRNPDFDRTEAVSEEHAGDPRFPHQHYRHPVQPPHAGYHDHSQRTAYVRSSSSTQLGVDAIHGASPQSHYHPQYRQHPTTQHQLFQGHHYFINDLLSASSSVATPDLAIASSSVQQLLNGKSCYYRPAKLMRVLQ